MGVPDWWTQRRFGLLVHGNIASVPAWAPIGQYADWYRAHIDGGVSDVLLQPSPLAESLDHHRRRWAHVEHYDDFLPFLTFDDYDADAWVALARDAGMGYAVMVAKHHDGLCWWDAPATKRTVLDDGPGRNVLGEFSEACGRADLVFGTYYSLLDWADDRYPSRAYVDDVVHPQVLDLVDRYGSRMLWGDGHWGRGGSHWRADELFAMARKLDPQIVVNDRWWADEPGVRSFEYRRPDGIVTESWEMRRGLGASFGLNRAEGADHLMSATDIVSLLTEVVAKGGHLLLSVPPDATGRVPLLHAERLRATGGWVRRHRDLVDRGTPWTTWGDDDCRYLVVDGVLHAIDVSGRGRFAAIDRSTGRVTSIRSVEDEPVAFEQDDTGVQIARPPRKSQRLPVVYRVLLDEPPPPPIALFPDAAAAPISLADALRGAARSEIVQLGEGTYIGPATIPAGVTVRGLGPTRTRLEGGDGTAVVLDAGARLEHCTLTGGGERIVWLPRVVVGIVGPGATLLGCTVHGHVEIDADDARITSCSLTGVVTHECDHFTLTRCTLTGMMWDCAVDIAGGSGHVVENCELTDYLAAIRLTDTVATTIRGNRVTARWWGVQLIDTESALVCGNSFERTMRAVDVDGGTLAEITGNAAIGGDSGCVVQRGASDAEVAGNHWERCRIGLLAWDAGRVRHHDNACIDLGEPDHGVLVGP
jgi:alpha-L-fucosidase